MLRRAGAVVDVTADADRVRRSERLLLPGVGAFDACRAALAARDGLEEAVLSAAKAGVPLLGICVGMQLLASGSDEGQLRGLDLIPGRVRRFSFAPELNLRVPHMGWSIVRPRKLAALFDRLRERPSRFYFVHSYHFQPDADDDIIGEADYGGPFVAAVQRDGIFGVQFHPEKSHRFGLILMQTFLDV